jgi:hypothetical protein
LLKEEGNALFLTAVSQLSYPVNVHRAMTMTGFTASD